MVFLNPRRIAALLALLAYAGAAISTSGEEVGGNAITLNRLPILDQPQAAPETPAPQVEDAPPAPSGPHPLLPAMKIAYRSYEFLAKEVEDYSCRVVKQERIDGRLRPVEYIDAKIRHPWRVGGRMVHPSSLYLKYVAPEAVAGREVLWVDGANDGKMVVRRGGRRFNYITVEIDPHSETAMRETGYAVMDTGMKTMVRKLIEIGLEDMKYGECDVQFFHEVKLDDRPCLCIQVTHPRRRAQFKFHVARIFVDDEHPVPLRYEAYDWPAAEGEAPPLLEQYTFQHLKLNVGFRDAEFRRDYPEYRFRE